ncbi:MAG: AMP-binding protein [Coriobacteriales bacterium]|jgi:acetyl-CoA synthetase|nr:AMP-binding protein [Coriobacteriales bacterium]
MRKIYKRYAEELYDEDGLLMQYRLHWPADYNFAYDVVDDIASVEPDRPAMIWCNPEGEEHVFSYGDLKYWSDKTANFLAETGVEKGELVLVILRRHYQFWFVALALNKLGAVIVPATFMLKEHDVAYRVNSAGIKTVICTDLGDIADVIDNSLTDCPSLETRIIVNGGGGGLVVRSGELDDSQLSGADGICQLAAQRPGWIDFNTAVLSASPSFARRESLAADPMIMYFSSGTSGNPKMVLHDASYSLAHMGTARHWQRVKADDGLHFTIADTGWGKAVWGKFYGQFLMEACVLTYDYDRFVPEEICGLIERYRVSTFCVPPTMYRMLLNSNIRDFDLSSIEHSVTAGEALSPDLFEGWRELTGLLIYEGFGQTETPVTVCNIKGMQPKPGSMGRPLPLYEIRIMNAEGSECETGQTGEICIKTDTGDPDQPYPPGIMLGYYRNLERTSETIYDGWYHSGDLAWRDELGHYWYVGRNDDVIKSSGYRIGPFEVESVIVEHPAVRECAVTGVPDPVRGFAVKASIVLNPGYEPSDALSKDIQDFVKSETAPYKYPRIISYLDELPKTVNGKIRRAAIRAADMADAEAAARRAPEEFGG